MLAMLLSAVMLTGDSPVSLQFDIYRRAPAQVQVSLCFQGAGQRVRFKLQVLSNSSAGRSRTVQSGELRTEAEPECPVINQITAPGPGRIEASLYWWIDNIEQAPETRTIELKQTTTNGPHTTDIIRA
ncbi:hypothetical protein HNR62_001829 [Oceanisphaera litoralis]|uniref:hypothetical protein n=1 Tax=Oceanisphaera litoralis TaxID=225144 RepID=UPI0019594EC9|nr:hypothetical protein [Oceanisphaera litoralis]MBM7455950.1 hypothetical protein [Oceanisphaera litoralis]